MGTSSLSAIRYLLNVDCRPTSSGTAIVEVGQLRRYDRPQPSMEGYEQLRPSWTEPPQADSDAPMANWPVATEVVFRATDLQSPPSLASGSKVVSDEPPELPIFYSPVLYRSTALVHEMSG